jgi:hypothetical protein
VVESASPAGDAIVAALAPEAARETEARCVETAWRSLPPRGVALAFRASRLH